MGFRGFFYYLKENNLSSEVDIYVEVEIWKRRNPDKTPILVVDFKSLAYCITRVKSDFICGGRHQVTLKCWENILKLLKRTGCDLVFFSDLNMTSSKMVTWMKRQDLLFKEYTKFYESVIRKKNFEKILNEREHLKPPNSLHHDMEILAQKYGDFHYSAKRENDLELAQFATLNDAFAVISDDFDFLIFAGRWKFFSSRGITESSLKITEYKRDSLLRTLRLTRQEMPLFATVWGNDFSKKLFETIEQAADFVRDKSSLKIDEIFKEILGQNVDLNVIQNSLDAYDVTIQPTDNLTCDPMENRLLDSKSKIYKFYMALMSPVQGISLLFYDMIETEPVINLSELIIRWTQRKIGILHQHKYRNGDSFKFIVATKVDATKRFAAFEKSPEYPDAQDISVPTLDQLYLENESRSVDIIETKWNILKWIMSFTESDIATLRKIKKEFRLICAILFALVKEKLLSVTEANGILKTEYMISDGVQEYVIPPTVLNAKSVRAAHKYNIVFSYVRENFAIAGLLPHITEIMKFDAVYYQQLMTKYVLIKDTERVDDMNPIKNGVMIANETEFDLF